MLVVVNPPKEGKYEERIRETNGLFTMCVCGCVFSGTVMGLQSFPSNRSRQQQVVCVPFVTLPFHINLAFPSSNDSFSPLPFTQYFQNFTQVQLMH